MRVQELYRLGELIAEQGPAAHESAFRDLAAAVADRLPAASSVLRDHAAPEVLRLRAFAVAVDALARQPWAGSDVLVVAETAAA